ncbi:MAG: AraC family transcriptional regulator [Saprospiraceae bacterium]|nr:AraC family transcriptional regulator [Saprospiraceae bacterium]
MTGITFNIWSVLILLGAAQGLFLSLFLLAKTDNRRENKWLALLLMVVSLHLLEYAADISQVTLKFPFLIAITYPLLFCMGPLYYLYCRYLLDKNYHSTSKSLLHFVPAVLVMLIMLPFYLTSASEKISYIQGFANNGILEIPTGQLVFMATHVLQTIVYVVCSYKFIGKTEDNLKRISSDVLTVKKLDWLKSFNYFFAIYLFLYLIIVIVLSVVQSYQIEIDYIMVLITSIALYSIGYIAIGNTKIFTATQEIQSTSIKKGSPSTRSGNRFPELKERLLGYMETNKPYLKNDLKISELADSLSVPYYQLSQLINDELSVNFYDFVNQYRVEEAKKLLVEDTRDFKILAIAFEVGFNSKATFNRVFKKVTDHTPSEFKAKYAIPQS